MRPVRSHGVPRPEGLCVGCNPPLPPSFLSQWFLQTRGWAWSYFPVRRASSADVASIILRTLPTQEADRLDSVGDRLCPLPPDLAQILGSPSGSSEVRASLQGPCLPTSRSLGPTTTPVLCPSTELVMHVPLPISLLPATPLRSLSQSFHSSMPSVSSQCSD